MRLDGPPQVQAAWRQASGGHPRRDRTGSPRGGGRRRWAAGKGSAAASSRAASSPAGRAASRGPAPRCRQLRGWRGDDGGGGLAGLEGLPPLAEKVPVDPSLVNGVDEGLLRGDGETPFTVTFLGGVAAKDNALGYYVVQDEEDGGAGEEGLIVEAGVLFASTEEAAPGATCRSARWRRGRRSACSWSRTGRS